MQRQQQRLAGGDAGVDDSESFDETDASADPSSASNSARHPKISAAEAYAAASRATTPLQDDLDELDRQVRAMRVRMDGRMDEWVWMGVCMSVCVCEWTNASFFEIIFCNLLSIFLAICHCPYLSISLPICALAVFRRTQQAVIFALVDASGCISNFHTRAKFVTIRAFECG